MMQTLIQTPTNKLENSISFYKKLNFTTLSDSNPTLVTDGKVVIEINPDRFARAGVKLYRESWSDIIEELKTFTTVILNGDNGYLLTDPSGVSIYLIEGKLDVNLENVSGSTLGNFAGVSLETIDINKSIKIWEKLGFKYEMGAIEQGWVAYKNADGMGVSFMKPNSCPHLFFNPSLTYFNGKENLNVIEKIRNNEIPITEEITHFNKEGIVDNIIIRDPGGYGFFIFSD